MSAFQKFIILCMYFVRQHWKERQICVCLLTQQMAHWSGLGQVEAKRPELQQGFPHRLQSPNARHPPLLFSGCWKWCSLGNTRAPMWNAGIAGGGTCIKCVVESYMRTRKLVQFPSTLLSSFLGKFAK